MLSLLVLLSTTKKLEYKKKAGLAFKQPSAASWSTNLTFSRIDLMIATIATNSDRCTPGISPGLEWCVPPVHGVRERCQLSWTELLGELSSLRYEIVSNRNFKETFEHRRALNAFDDVMAMSSIYRAHLGAIQSLCSERQSTGIKYGLVLESDARKLNTWRKEDLLSVILAAHDFSIFNIAPTTDICSDNSRLSAIFQGRCFRSHRLNSWGAVAVVYDLERICTNAFFKVHNTLFACTPTDIGLFSGAGGYLAADSSVAYFKCEAESTSEETHATDKIHRDLNITNERNKVLSIIFHSSGHSCSGFMRSSARNLPISMSPHDILKLIGCPSSSHAEKFI